MFARIENSRSIEFLFIFKIEIQFYRDAHKLRIRDIRKLDGE